MTTIPADFSKLILDHYCQLIREYLALGTAANEAALEMFVTQHPWVVAAAYDNGPSA